MADSPDSTVEAAAPEASAEVAEQPVADDSASSQPDQAEGTPEKKPSGGGFQKRIESLTRQKYELAQRVQELESRASAAPPASQPAAAEEKPQAEGDFTDYYEYTQAVARFEARQEAKAIARAERESDQRQRSESTAREQLQRLQQDFAVQVETLSADIPDLVQSIGHVNLNGSTRAALLQSDKGAAVLSYLGAHPAGLARIEAIGNPVKAAIEIARLESKADAMIQQRTRSNAPKASAPLGQGGRAPVRGPGDGDSMEDWVKKRREQIYRR